MGEFGQEKPQGKAKRDPAADEAAAWRSALNQDRRLDPQTLIDRAGQLRREDPIRDTLITLLHRYGGPDRLLSPEEISAGVKDIEAHRVALGLSRPRTERKDEAKGEKDAAASEKPKREGAAKAQPAPVDAAKSEDKKPEPGKSSDKKAEGSSGSPMRVAKGLGGGVFGGPKAIHIDPFNNFGGFGQLNPFGDFELDERAANRYFSIAQDIDGERNLQAQIRDLFPDGPNNAKGMSATDISMAADIPHIQDGLNFIQRHFARIDEDKDGSVSKAEIENLMKRGILTPQKLVDLDSAQAFLEGIKIAQKAERTDVYTQADIKEAQAKAATLPDINLGARRMRKLLEGLPDLRLEP